MRIQLTEIQIWFIKKAIDLKDVVIPLSDEIISDDDFENDYGYKKDQIIKSINLLKEKIN